jgi:hypothetical protein
MGCASLTWALLLLASATQNESVQVTGKIELNRQALSLFRWQAIEYAVDTF